MNDQETSSKGEWDLTERTARFGEAVIALCRGVPRSPINDPLVGQLVRSASGIGANYCEANDSDSKKDFARRINICLREAKETKHWLRMLAAADAATKDEARSLWQEAKELTLIFGSIRSKL